MAGGSASGDPAGAAAADPLVWESFFWGLLSAVSLNIGSVIGVTCLPSQRARAVLMSFGGGALLFALSIELFGSVLHRAEDAGSKDTVWVMEGSAVVGGLCFALLNYLLNVLGADVRKPSTKKGRFARLRALLLRRLTLRLSKIPFFSVLTLKELGDLIQSAMYKERFSAGDTIMSRETNDSGIFFILSGIVRLQIFGKDCPSPGSPKGTEAGKDRWAEDDRILLNSWDLSTNQIFGDMTVLCGSYLQAQAIALEATKVLVLPGHEVARLIEENAAVRDQISLRAVERLRQVAELRHLPDHALASLSHRCALVRYQPGDVIFNGCVNALTPVLCLVLGSTEFRSESGARRTLHACRLLCTEHLKTCKPSKPFTLVALEPCSVLIIHRGDIDMAMPNTQQENAFMLRVPSEPPAAPLVVPAEPPSLPGEVPATSWKASREVLRVYTSEEAEPKSEPRTASHRSFERRVSSSTVGEGPLPRLNSLGHDLGWDELVAVQDPEEQLPAFGRFVSANMGQVTDLELEEHELDLHTHNGDERRRSSSKTSVRVSSMSMVRDSVASPEVESVTAASRPHPESPIGEKAVTIAKGEDGMVTAFEGPATAAPHDKNQHRAVMIWLGILIDAVPESLVIGILINKSAGVEGEDRFSSSAAAALPFVIGVFLSNLPESMSSSGSMKLHGMRVSTILMMWLATTVLTAVGASLGAVLFPPGSSGDHSAELAVVSVEGLAAGAMLTMIAQTMMPEAFEQGGDIVGLSCLAGFLCALTVKLIPLGEE